jgi:hypothetical protein
MFHGAPIGCEGVGARKLGARNSVLMALLATHDE